VAVSRPAPEFPDAIDLYRVAMDEYRFQVNLNWQRTQHWFTINIAIPGAAIGLLRIAKGGTFFLVAAIFLCGALACAVAVIASATQRGYYRAIRDHKGRIETWMGLGELAIVTTVGMGSGGRRLIRVTTLYTLLLLLLGLLDLGGGGYAIFRTGDIHLHWPSATWPHGSHWYP
jgi:hypothetical protein